MNIGILGTGMVGRAHAERLSQLGHTVILGTQDVVKTLANTEKDARGNVPFREWHADHEGIQLATFAEAAAHGDIVYNALKGAVVLEVLGALKSELANKTLVDISNPLDFSKGMPPSLFVCNTDSLGEQIQSVLPDTKVVKTLNTMNIAVQIDPYQLADGDHHIFVSGNDEQAKVTITQILKAYGWQNIIDLGDITTARATEMYLPLYMRLFGVFKSPRFNLKIVR